MSALETQAWIKSSQNEKIERGPIPLRNPGPGEARVQFTCSGLCHSDCLMADNDWKISRYPTVLGHEGIGNVVEIGPGVKGLSVGDRVGLGWISGSCGYCANCRIGFENLCTEGLVQTIIGDNCLGGTFSENQVVSVRFLHRIPDCLPDAVAAPLMCAGVTVFAPIRRWVKTNMKVGIIALGGLGHYGVQFAKALGAEVAVFSTSMNKADDAKKFGAKSFHLVDRDNGIVKDAEVLDSTFDFILNTSPAPINAEAFLKLLAPNGVLCFAGAPPAEQSTVTFQIPTLLGALRTISSSSVGGSSDFMEMLKLATIFPIQSSVKCRDISEINEVFDDVSNSNMNGYFRYVLCHENNASKMMNEVDEYHAKF